MEGMRSLFTSSRQKSHMDHQQRGSPPQVRRASVDQQRVKSPATAQGNLVSGQLRRRTSGTFNRGSVNAASRRASGNPRTSRKDETSGGAQHVAEYYLVRLKVAGETLDQMTDERNEAVAELVEMEKVMQDIQKTLETMETRLEDDLKRGGVVTPATTFPRRTLRDENGATLPRIIHFEDSDHKHVDGQGLGLAQDGRQLGEALISQAQALETTVELMRKERDKAMAKRDKHHHVELAGRDAKIALLTEARTEAVNSSRKLQYELKGAQSSLKQAAGVVEKTRTEAKELQGQLKQVQAGNRELLKDRNKAVEQERKLRAQIEAMEASLAAYEKMVHTSTSRIQELEIERNSVVEQLQELNRILKSAKKDHDGRVAETSRQREAEKRQATQLKSLVDKREDEKRDLGEKLAALEKSLRDEQKVTRDLHRKLETASKEKEKLVRESETQRKRASDASRMMSQSKTNLMEAKGKVERDVDSLRDNVKILEKRLSAERKQYELEVDGLQRELAKSKEMASNVAKDRDEQIAKTVTLEVDLRALQEANDGLERKVNFLEAKSAADVLNNSQIDDNRAQERESEAAVMDELRQKVVASESQLRKTELDLADRETRLQQAQRELDDATAHASSHEGNLTQARETICSLEEKIAGLNAQSEASAAAEAELLSKLTRVEAELEVARKTHEEQMQKGAVETARHAEVLSGLEEREAEIGALNNRLEGVQSALDVARKEAWQLTVEKENATSELSHALERTKALSDERDGLEAKVDLIRNDRDDLRSQVTAARNEVLDLTKQVAVEKEEKKKQHAESSLVAAERDQLVQSQAASVAKVDELEAQLTQMRVNMEAKQGEFERETELLSSLRRELTNAEEQNLTLTGTLAEHERAFAEGESERRRLLEEVDCQARDAKTLHSKVSQALKRLEDEASKRRELKSRLDAARSASKTATEERKKVELECAQLKDKVDHLARARSDLEKSKLKGEKLEAAVLRVFQNHSIDTVASEDGMHVLNSRLESLQAEERSASEAAERERKHAADLVSEYLEKEQGFEKERAKLKQNIQKLKEISRNRSSALDEELEEMSQKNDELTVEIHAVKRNLDETTEKLGEASAELEVTSENLCKRENQLASVRQEYENLLEKIERQRFGRRLRFFFVQAPMIAGVAVAVARGIANRKEAEEEEEESI